MNFIEELKWRGMLHDIMPGTEEQLQKEVTSAYIGFDPTANSLHIGHLAGVMLLMHFQKSGHRPIVLIGGATGMIGDPSMKSEERVLLDETILRENQEAIKRQLEKLLKYHTATSDNETIFVNNYDWMKNFSFIDFIRKVGKLLTVNYMLAKDSVKRRIVSECGAGLSFTEFTYQLIQGYDFVYLHENFNCKLQMGGSDQWGNITTGAEMIRKITGNEVFALTCPLITKADGGKFGKTETGTVWLDANKTSCYAFYQFWLNVSDIDAKKYIKIFTLLDKPTIDTLIEEHEINPQERKLQKRLAFEVTSMVHSCTDCETAQKASDILFGEGTQSLIEDVNETILEAIFSTIPTYHVDCNEIINGISILELLVDKTSIFPSKGELRRIIKSNGLSINKEKYINDNGIINQTNLIKNKYILIQKGKKNYYLIVCD